MQVYLKITKLLLILFTLVFFFLVSTSKIVAKTPDQILVKARVVEIIEEGEKNFETLDQNIKSIYQKVKVEILEGKDGGTEIIINHGDQLSIRENQKVQKNQIVVLTQMENLDGYLEYFIVDKYRLDFIIYLALAFFALVIILSRLKGVGSILGMFLSIMVIVKYVVPQILSGSDPLTTSIIGSIFILITSIYLAHGLSKSTTVAVISTSLTLVITGLLSVVFVNAAHLSGLGSEDASSLMFGSTSDINFKGLLLGGMIIGFLGVLDDITTGLSATVFELKKVNKNLGFNDLVKSSLTVGREHISSLVNTLILAYAGASLPLFLYIVLNPQGYPLWFVINSELISEEIVRTLTGSVGLLLAVPITTLLAAWMNSNDR